MSDGPLYCRALTPAEQEAFARDFPEFVAASVYDLEAKPEATRADDEDPDDYPYSFDEEPWAGDANDGTEGSN